MSQDTLAAAQMDSYPACGLCFYYDCFHESGQLFILKIPVRCGRLPTCSRHYIFNLGLLDDLIEHTCSFACKWPTLF